MPEIRINNKVFLTQTGAAEPVLASNVDLGSALANATFPVEASPIQKIISQSISGATTYSFDDVFSETYHSYEIVLTSGVWTEVAGALLMRLRTSSGDETNTIYNNRTITVSGAGAAVAEFGNGNDKWGLTYGSNTLLDAISVHVFLQNPYLAAKTTFWGHSRDNVDQSGGSINSTTQYTGFTIFSSIATNFSGTLHLYGYR